MALSAVEIVNRIWVVAALAAGILFVTLGNTLLSTVGVVVTILGLMGLMPIVVRNGLADQADGDASVPDADAGHSTH